MTKGVGIRKEWGECPKFPDITTEMDGKAGKIGGRDGAISVRKYGVEFEL